MASLRLQHGEVLRISSNRWNENCFVLVADGSSECVVVDPGYDSEAIIEAIVSRALGVGGILAGRSSARLQLEETVRMIKSLRPHANGRGIGRALGSHPGYFKWADALSGSPHNSR